MIAKIAALPAPVRHGLLLLATGLLTWLGTDVIPFLQSSTAPQGGLIAAVLTGVLAVATPLVNSYGVGKTEDA